MKQHPLIILVSTLITCAALAFIASPAEAQKKKGKAKAAKKVVTYATPLKAQPGEAAKTITELEVGAEVEVMGRKGRWVRVRTGGKLGWVTRTTIGAPEGDGEAWGGDKINVDGTGKATEGEAVEVFAVRRTKARNRPSKKGDKVFRVRRSDRLLVIDRKGTKWLQVRNGEGVVGWIRSSAVETASGQAIGDADEEFADIDESTDLVDPDDPSIADFESDAGPDRTRLRLSERGLELAADAAIGLSSYSRTFSSNGESALGGYRINAGTMAASASALARMHFGDLFSGVRAAFSTNIGAPGIRFQNEDGDVSEPNGFQVHRLGIELEVGATLGDSHPIRMAASVGYGLGYFVVSKIQENPGLIAREKLAGVKVGLSASTGLSRDILVAAEFDLMPSASLAQTENLEDGMDSRVWSMGGGAKASYLIDDRHTLEAGYRGERVKYRFTGQSTRQFDVTSARRKDIYHSFMIGAARAF